MGSPGFWTGYPHMESTACLRVSSSICKFRFMGEEHGELLFGYGNVLRNGEMVANFVDWRGEVSCVRID